MNNVAFMHAAYVVVWVILGGYSADLLARYWKLKKELRDLSSTPPSARKAHVGGAGQEK